MSAPDVAVLPVGELEPGLRRTLEQWFDRQFGHIPIEWAPPEWYVTARLDERLVGRLSVVRRTVRAGDQLVEVGGVAGVTTLLELRRQGIASALMQRTRAFVADELGLPFGLLLCRAEVAPVYARAGWKKVAGPTSFHQSKGAQFYGADTMILRCGSRAWPDGPIDLCGLPW